MANYVDYNDIIKAATMRLTKSFVYPVYASETTEGYKAPCFFVDLLPVSTVYETSNIAETTMTLIVTFFNDSDNSIENRTVLMDLRRAFRLKLHVDDRYLNITESTAQMIGDTTENKYMSSIAFDIVYKEDISEKVEHEVAQELHFNGHLHVANRKDVFN